MGRNRSKPNRSSNGKNGRSRKSKISRHDESDQSSFHSDCEGSYSNRYDSSSDSMSSRKSSRGRRTRSRRFQADDSASESYRKDYSSDDYSYKPTKRNVKEDSKRNMSRSKPGSRSHRRDDFSDSDESGVYGIGDNNLNRSGRHRDRRTPVKRNESQKHDDFMNIEGRYSNDCDSFSTRIEQMRREHDEFSSSSGDDSVDGRLYRQTINSRANPQNSGSESNVLQLSFQSLGSGYQQARDFNSSFNSLGHLQSTITARENSLMRRSNSCRSFAGYQQPPPSGQLIENTLVNRGQEQRMARIPNNILKGNLNPTRLPHGLDNSMKSMPNQMINTSSTAQEQSNWPIQNDINQSPIRRNSMMMPGTSEGNVGSRPNLFDPSMQRCGSIRGVSNRSVGNVVHEPPLLRVSSQKSLGKMDALINTAINYQQMELMRATSHRNQGNGDGSFHLLVNSQQSSQSSLGASNPPQNNGSMYSKVPSLMKGASQTSLSSNQRHPNVRMKKNKQLYDRTENTPWPMNGASHFSVVEDSVMVMSGASGNTSVASSRSRRSSKSRQSLPPQSLADQIYSRSRRSRYNDTQSLGSYADPPGVDCNQLKKGSNRIHKRNHNDDASDKVFEDDEESFTMSNDPPDMFDVIGVDPEPDERTYGSYESRQSQGDYYSDESSSVSSLDDEDKYGYRESRISISQSSVSSSTSAGDYKKGSRFSSDIAFEYDQSISSPRRISQEEPMSWLAKQISARKLTDKNIGSAAYLEPKGESINKKLTPDNSTTTTGTLTNDVPSIIISREGINENGYTDIDSLLSFPDEEYLANPAERVKKKGNNSTKIGRQEKCERKSSKKKERKKKDSKEKPLTRKTTKSKKDRSNDFCLEEVVEKCANSDTGKEHRSKKKKKKSGVENESRKTESSKSKKKRSKTGDETRTKDRVTCSASNPIENKRSQKHATKVSLKSNEGKKKSEYSTSRKKSKETRSGNRKRDDDERAGAEDVKVMNLIDKLRSYELSKD